jgi:hypothetical protein
MVINGDTASLSMIHRRALAVYHSRSATEAQHNNGSTQRRRDPKSHLLCCRINASRLSRVPTANLAVAWSKSPHARKAWPQGQSHLLRSPTNSSASPKMAPYTGKDTVDILLPTRPPTVSNLVVIRCGQETVSGCGHAKSDE